MEVLHVIIVALLIMLAVVIGCGLYIGDVIF